MDEIGAAPHLHKDKAELVHVGGQMLHNPPWFVLGQTVNHVQVGGTR